MDEHHTYEEATETFTVLMSRGGFKATVAGHTLITARIACLEMLRAKCGHLYSLPTILG